MAEKKAKISKQEAAAIAAVFGNASEVETPKAKKTSTSGQIPMGNNFEGYVALLLLEKTIEAVKKQLGEECKEKKAWAYFLSYLEETGCQPPQVEGVEGSASAVFQYKKIGAGFNLEVANDLTEHGIEFEHKEAIPERYTINPLLLQDQKKLAQLSTAIAALGLDYEVVQKQKPKFKYQFTDDTLRQIIKLKDKKVRAQLLRDIASIAVAQPKLGGVGIDKKTSPEQKSDVLAAALKIIQDHKILDLAVEGGDDDEV